MNEELRDKVRTLGLDRLTEEHLAQFERATNRAAVNARSGVNAMKALYLAS